MGSHQTIQKVGDILSSSSGGIPVPHGGKLINRFATTKRDIDEIFSIEVCTDLRNDIENIADGIFSPIEGFVGQDDFQGIVRNGRLKNGLAWTIPIMLDVDEITAKNMQDAREVGLRTGNDYFGVVRVEEVYSIDKLNVIKAIYHTDDLQHPGVNKMVRMKDRLI
ncbi:MAG TPA: hypothetical protein VIP56_09350, partial [Nitrososphaeraceae archaeon]